MARAAVLGRLNWLAGEVTALRDETATARTIVLSVPGWPGHAPGQHVDVRLTADDGYSAPPDANVRVGRISGPVLAADGWRPGDAPAVFACGPSGFVEAAASLLTRMGHDASAIKTERFGPTGR